MNPHLTPPARGRSRLALTLGAMSLVLPFSLALADEPASIPWREDYATAMEEARSSDRLLWIQFTGPWCPNCTRMERDSFAHPPIVEHSVRTYVPLKLRSDLNEELAATLSLTAIPATVIVAPNRDIVALHQGYLGPEELDGLLRDCKARSSPAPAAEKP